MLILTWSAIQPFHAERDAAAERRRIWTAEVTRLAGLLDALPSDVEKTTFLRSYAGALIDIGRPDTLTQQRFRSLDFDSFDAAEFYPLFEADHLPANCGITTFFYIKLLHALGFKAYQYSFGFTAPPFERFIHSVVLVDVDVGGTRRLIVQDPYLNVTYVTRDGEAIDFFELLAALKRRQYDHVVMDPSSAATSLLVPDTSLYYPYLSEPCRAAMAGALRRPDGSVRTALPIARDYATLMQSSCGGFERDFVEALRQNGIAEPFIYAYTLRASDLVGSPDHPDLQRQIDAVLR